MLTRRHFAALAAGAMLGVPRSHVAVTQSADLDDRIEDALSDMNLRERVAQLFTMPVLDVALTPEETAFLTGYRPGGVLLVANNIGTDDKVRALTAAIAATNPALPPFRAIDQEGGIVARLAGDPAPDAPMMGWLPDEEVSSLARARAEYLAGFGIDINFAPVADVAWTPDSFMTGRAFGDDPVLVAEKVAAYVSGVDGLPVFHCAKHFPGHGRPSTDSHLALPTVDLDQASWLESDALPFAAAIDAGVPMVMLGHLAYPQWDALPATVSPEAIRVLREDLGFEGAIVTDDLGMGALSDWTAFEVIDLAIAAGVDMLLYAIPTAPPEELIEHLVARVETGEVDPARIDASVRRLLRIKLVR
jgi:beta-N-acetylhexosaminidase